MLLPHEVTKLRGMRITTAARTVLDLAARLRPRQLEQLLDRAEQRRLLDVRDLRRALADHPRRAGAPTLASVLDAYAPTVTRSELEERFLELCDHHGLPRPLMNRHLAGFEVDAQWPGTTLVVELDGYAYDRSPSAFEPRPGCRARARRLPGLRFSYRQIVDEPARVSAALRLLTSDPT